MRFIIVRISPQRWVLAEHDGDKLYNVFTRSVSSWEVAVSILHDVENREESDYSEQTKSVILDD